MFLLCGWKLSSRDISKSDPNFCNSKKFSFKSSKVWKAPWCLCGAGKYEKKLNKRNYIFVCKFRKLFSRTLNRDVLSSELWTFTLVSGPLQFALCQNTDNYLYSLPLLLWLKRFSFSVAITHICGIISQKSRKLFPSAVQGNHYKNKRRNQWWLYMKTLRDNNFSE